jgi:hypothetical protein
MHLSLQHLAESIRKRTPCLGSTYSIGSRSWMILLSGGVKDSGTIRRWLCVRESVNRFSASFLHFQGTRLIIENHGLWSIYILRIYRKTYHRAPELPWSKHDWPITNGRRDLSSCLEDRRVRRKTDRFTSLFKKDIVKWCELKGVSKSLLMDQNWEGNTMPPTIQWFQ